MSVQTLKSRGFTLVEVVMAVCVATMALLALLGTSITAYKINNKARLRDNARAVLRSYVDQFQRLAYSNDSNVVRMLFTTTSSPTGLGLRWGSLSDEINYAGAPTTLQINIGSAGSPQTATVTRSVTFVNSNTGNTSTSKVMDAAGFMLSATFTITYTPSGSSSSITQSMSTLRLID
jgi:type II secretory pathway pseudopilin PulG